jgi:putative tricarboxylic transport membrane protein
VGFQQGKMDLIHGIINVFSPLNLFYCLLGCLLGTLVGVLPGLGPATTMAILLPITMYLNPTGSIIMLAGIYYGAQYGGSTTSILVNIPGETSSVPTCFDGYPMTKQGRAGQALCIAAIGSFIAGTFGAIGISFVGIGVAKYALKFGPAEYFALLFFSLTALISISASSIIKGLGAGVTGLILASMGTDPMTGVGRLTFGTIGLTRGLEIIPVAVGLFGIGEILINAEAGIAKIYEGKLGKMMPRGKDLKKGLGACLRGTILGLPLGVIPGIAPPIASFLAYDLEKKISKYPERFGSGVIEGVAAPEAANNATAQTGFLPLMAFGIPTSPAMAIILTALMINGLKPGPLLFQEQRQFIWTVIGSMYIGNAILLVLNLPLVGLWARISVLPYKYLGPVILGICVIGAYSSRNTMFDVWVALGAGVLGYVMRKKNWPMAPLILGFVLGPLFEEALRQSLSIGGPLIFFRRPISVVLFVLAVLVVIISLKYLRRISKGDDPGL